MKTNVLLAFFFSVALFAFTTAELVYDSNGEPLINGGKYYLSTPGIGGPAIEGAIIEKGDDSCSLAVVGKLHHRGWSTRIASPVLLLHITTEIPLWISFVPLPRNPCTTNPEWLVIREIGFGYPVMVGDAKEFTTPVSGWFYIKPYDSAEHHYKLVFCHEQDNCRDVGEKTDSHGNLRLVLKQGDPLVLKFVKATSDIAMVV